MRISEKEIINLLQVFKNFNLLPDCKVFLFGSRIDDAKKGGDIDLLLLCPEDIYFKTLENKFRIKAELEYAAGDQRVDLTLATLYNLTTDPFLRSIRDHAVQIN